MRLLLRGLRLLIFVVGIAFGLGLTALSAAILYARTDAGRARVRTLVLAQARKTLPGLDIGRIGGDYLRELSLEDVSLRDGPGRRVHVDRIAARFDLLPLLRRTVRVHELRVVRPTVRWGPPPEGPHPAPTATAPRSEGEGEGEGEGERGGGRGARGWRLEIDRILVDDGGLDLETAGGTRVQLADLAVEARASAGAGVAAIEVRRLRASARAGAGARLLLRGHADLVQAPGAGGLTLGGYDVRLDARDVDLAAVLPAAHPDRLSFSLAARGRGVPLATGSHATVTLDAPRARLAEITIEPVHVRAESTGPRWRLPHTVVRATGARLALSGAGEGPHFTADGTADLHAAGRAPFPGLRGDGRLRARVRGDVAGHLDIAADGEARRLVAGAFRLGAATLRGRVVVAAASGRPPRGDLHVDARALRVAAGVPTIETLRLDAASDGRWLRVQGAARGARVQAQVAARGPLSAHAAAITVERLALSYETRTHAQRLELARPTEIRYRAGDRIEVAPFEVRGSGYLLTGTVTASGSYRLRPGRDQPVADLRLALRRASVRGFDPVDADLHATLERRRASLAMEARAAGGRLLLDAAVPVVVPRRGPPRLGARGPVAVHLQTGTIDLAKLPVLERRLARAGVSGGKLTATATVEGDIAAPAATVAIDLSDSTIRNASGFGLESHLKTIPGVGASLRLEVGTRETHAAGTLIVRRAEVLRFDARVEQNLRALAGGAPAAGAPLAGTVEIPGLELATLADISDAMRGVHGRLSGRIAVAGTLGRPSATGNLAVGNASVDDVAFRRVAVHGEMRDGRIDLSADVAQANGGSLRAQARVEPRRHGAFTARLDAKDIDVAFVRPFLPPVRELGGTLQASAEASGTLAAPVVHAEASVATGRVGLIGQPTFKDVTLVASVRPGRLDLSSLSLRSGKGSFTGKGWAILDSAHGLRPLSVTFTGHAQELLVAISGTTGARIDGDIAVEAARRDAVLAGKVEVPRAVVLLPSLDVGGGRKLQPTGLRPDVRFVDPAALAAEERQRNASRAPRRPLELDLQAKAGPVYIRSKDLDLELDSRLHFAPPPGARGAPPVLTGTVRVRSGRIDIQGRRFEVEHADLTFDGSPKPNPALDVRLTRQFPQTTVAIQILGTLENPDLRLSTEPPIYDKAQIVSLIVSGDPGGGPSTGKPFDATGAVASLVLGRIADQLAPQIGLDVLRVENIESRATPGGAPFGFTNTRIEVGKYVSDRIYVSYAHIFGAPENANVNEAHLEYRVTRRWLVETVFGDAGVGSIDALWNWRR